MISVPSPPPIPAPPPPPANPPMFGASQNTAGRQQGAQVNPQSGFGATILGQGNPANTGQKTLLGQ
jgi:hypothetical protein